MRIVTIAAVAALGLTVMACESPIGDAGGLAMMVAVVAPKL